MAQVRSYIHTIDTLPMCRVLPVGMYFVSTALRATVLALAKKRSRYILLAESRELKAESHDRHIAIGQRE